MKSKQKMCFLHRPFLNRDFSLDIVRKCIKILTVILTTVLEGSMSHFFDVGLLHFLWHLEKKSRLFFTIFYVSHDKKITKA